MHRAPQDESFVSSRSVASRSQSTSTKTKSGKVEPYVSPFVAKAAKRAEERVKQAHRAQQRTKPKIAYEWDESINTPGLFDPKIRKQEIFRLQPKRNINKQGSRDDGDDSRDIMDTSLFDSSFSSSTNKNRITSTNRRVTMRTEDISPRRAPSTRIMPKSVFQGGTYPAVRTSNDSNNSCSTAPHSKHPVTSHKPPLSHINNHNNQVVHHRKGVTRSTSPIDESVVDDILTAEPQHQHEKDYKLRHHRNSAADHRNHDQQHQSLHCSGTGKMDRAAAKELYGNMIRERLRAILMQHRGGGTSEGNEFHGSTSMNNGSSSRRGFYGPSRVQQEQELAARDLMASMATIMTAVGEIVNMKSHKKKWYKQSLRRSRSASAARDGISPEREYYPSNTHMENSRVAPNTTQFSANGGGYMTAASQRTPAAVAALTRPDLSPNPYYRPTANEEEGKKSTANFMFDLARTIEPMSYAPDIQLPENKATAFDMIMSKLQSIEQCEREMQIFLQHPRRAVDDEGDDQPVDPVLRDLQQSMARKAAEERQTLSKASPRNHDTGMPTTTALATGGDVTSTYPMQAAGIKAGPSSNEGYAFLKQYPSLAQISSELRPGLEDYKKQLNKARQLREVAFARKNSTSAITGDTVADAIFDKLTIAVAEEIDRFTEDYSKHFATQL